MMREGRKGPSFSEDRLEFQKVRRRKNMNTESGEKKIKSAS